MLTFIMVWVLSCSFTFWATRRFCLWRYGDKSFGVPAYAAVIGGIAGASIYLVATGGFA